MFFSCDTTKMVKWKQGLPQVIKTAITDSIRDQRNERSTPLHLIVDFVSESQGLRDKLLEFEAYDPLVVLLLFHFRSHLLQQRAKCFSIGVVYSKEGQTNENEV